jgi:DNA polymerase III subunit delta'
MAFLPTDILQRLRRAREHGRLPHAMLITGTPGSGRSRLALEIAALVNDTTPEDAAAHPDVHKLEPGSKSRRILVEPFREFCQPFFSTSFRAGATKTGIILDADRLHLNAANAFLKTLEEPPDHTLFILVTSNPGLLPVTIVSRCAHFPLRTAKLPDLSGPAAEVAAATGEVLATPDKKRLGAALRLARRLQFLLRDARESVETEISAAFKEEKKRLGDTAEEDWLKEEEARLKALVEARVLATRQHLVSIVAERTADVLRARHGVEALQFPALAAESRRLAALFDDAALLRVLDGAARLRLFLDRNVKEDIALEAGCLALARS